MRACEAAKYWIRIVCFFTYYFLLLFMHSCACCFVTTPPEYYKLCMHEPMLCFQCRSLLSWCWYLCFCFMTVLLCTERYFGCDETLFCSPLTSGLQYSFCNLYNFSLPLDSPQPWVFDGFGLFILERLAPTRYTKFSCSFYLNLCGCWLNGNKILCSYYYIEVLFDVAIYDVSIWHVLVFRKVSSEFYLVCRK